MSQDDDSDRKKRKNPWGGSDDRGQRPPNNPWGGQNGGGNRGNGGNNPNDFDDFLKNTQEAVRDMIPGNLNGGMMALLIALVILLLWLASGFHIVNPGEQGVIQRFGAWSRTQDAEGLGYHIPAPVERITKVNVSELRRLQIGINEVVRRDDEQQESLMLTSDRNIVNLQVEVQWDIHSAEDYLFNIDNPENTIKKVAESAIREVVGQTEMFTVITTGRTKIVAKIKDIIQKNLDEYNSGVSIKQVLLKKAEVHPQVQPAFQDVQSAKQIAEDTQNQAQAYREGLLPEARGQAVKLLQEAQAYKQSQIAKATGDADRFKAIYAAYQSGKDVTKERIYIETMEKVLSNAEKIILSSDKNGQGVVPYLPLDSLKTAPAKQ